MIHIDNYIRYCRNYSDQSNELIRDILLIRDNLDGNNRGGHLKQAYYAFFLFLERHSQYIETILSSPLDSPFDLANSNFIDYWKRFLRRNRNLINNELNFNIPTLISILPPSLGGDRMGGGGGSHPLKIIIPILSKFYKEIFLTEIEAKGIKARYSRKYIRTVRRDSKIVNELKFLTEHKCQICQKQFQTNSGYYIEGHHIKPLGNPHNGPDIKENIIILCPNHHIEMDYGILKIDPSNPDRVKHIDNTNPFHNVTISQRHSLNIEILRYSYENL